MVAPIPPRPPGPQAVRYLGRFQLLRLLSKSARTMAWRVMDPRVGQELVLMLPRIPPADDAALQRWMDNAHQAARIDHPGLAHAVEVGEHERWPFIAYDLGTAATLSERMGGKALSGAELVPWALLALQGLAFAHEAGVAHRDLQTGMLEVCETGCRLLGLGVALPPPDESRGLPALHRASERDVLAFGLVLHHALAGMPALETPDVGLAMSRMPPLGREIVRLPWTGTHPIPDALRAIVNRATDRQERQRYRNARTLERALAGWHRADGASGGGPIALLLDRMHAAGLLPAMPGGAGRAARLASMERERTIELAEIVLQDVGLCFEMLRMANGNRQRGALGGGSGAVLTLRRAIAMLGIDGVRRAALSLRTWPGPLSDAHAAELGVLVDRVALAGRVAQWLRPPGYDEEVVYVLTMLQNLGRLVVQYHFPEEAAQIRRLMQPAPPQRSGEPEDPGMAEEVASFAVLGVDIDALGSAVGHYWGLEDPVLQMMRRVPQRAPVHQPDSDDETLRLIASCANDVVDSRSMPPHHRAAYLQRVVQRYGRPLGLTARDILLSAQGVDPNQTESTESGEAGPEVRPARSGAVSSLGPAVHRPGQRLGRFRLLAELGRGAQAVVWRARDERLDREVALKLRLPGADAVSVDTWLHEARAVGRLAHPHIVPVFEAFEIDGQPCLVFELVTGRTLAEVLQRSGAMPAREAVELMLGVVDALRAAHAQGIVHRDLKPSNILIDADGRARVMDFGIAARLAGPADGTAGCVVGSPGYLSPEAAAGAAPSPQMDVFAAGLVLGELLAGAPLLSERVPLAAVRRVQQEDLLLPAEVDVDDRLRAVLQRAIARDPTRRYDSAASLRDALMQWLAPADAGPADGQGGGHGTLEFLLRRMRHKSDFPALTDHVVRIQRMASSDSENLNHLADEILKDVALTHKLLRLVNTVNFRRHGHGVSTVSRAVALVGLAGIRNLALSLVLVEHMKDKGHAQRLKEEFLRALMAGRLAHALSSTEREAEEAFLGAMFHNLGRLLTEYYFPDEAEAIRAQLRLNPPRGEARQHPEQAADRAAGIVLGLSYEALGIGVARHWGLPESLQRSMRRPDKAPPTHALPAGPERQRWLALAANELAELLWHADGEALPSRLEALAERHGRALGLSLDDLRQATDSARFALAQMAPTMGLVLPQGTRGQRLIGSRPGAPDLTDSLAPHELAALPTARNELSSAEAATVRLAPNHCAVDVDLAPVTDLLAAGIQDITDTLAGDSFRLNEVLRMVLETMYRALGFQRVVFCLRDAGSGRLHGRFGLGQDAAALSPHFQVALRWPPGQTPDLIAAVCLKGSDTLIPDSRQPQIAQRLPAWYRQQVDAPSFLLLPMVMKGATFALIYADQSHPGGLALGDRELALLRTLRNQAVMAFRQASHVA